MNATDKLHPTKRLNALLSTITRQSQTADCAPGAAATWGVTLSTRHFLVPIYAGTLIANIMS